MRAANQPFVLKSCGSVTASGSFSRKCGDIGFFATGFASTPVAFGRCPVRNEDRLGLHNGDRLYARSNLTPRAASLSMFGVRTAAP